MIENTLARAEKTLTLRLEADYRDAYRSGLDLAVTLIEREIMQAFQRNSGSDVIGPLMSHAAYLRNLNKVLGEAS